VAAIFAFTTTLGMVIIPKYDTRKKDEKHYQDVALYEASMSRQNRVAYEKKSVTP
jgi:hypothetical protein